MENSARAPKKEHPREFTASNCKGAIARCSQCLWSAYHIWPTALATAFGITAQCINALMAADIRHFKDGTAADAP